MKPDTPKARYSQEEESTKKIIAFLLPFEHGFQTNSVLSQAVGSLPDPQ
jgi:hypothetical protein